MVEKEVVKQNPVLENIENVTYPKTIVSNNVSKPKQKQDDLATEYDKLLTVNDYKLLINILQEEKNKKKKQEEENKRIVQSQESKFQELMALYSVK